MIKSIIGVIKLAKLEDAISRLIGGDEGIFGNKIFIVIAIVFLILCTDILENIFDDDNMWIWFILILLILFNFDQENC